MDYVAASFVESLVAGYVNSSSEFRVPHPALLSAVHALVSWALGLFFVYIIRSVEGKRKTACQKYPAHKGPTLLHKNPNALHEKPNALHKNPTALHKSSSALHNPTALHNATALHNSALPLIYNASLWLCVMCCTELHIRQRTSSSAWFSVRMTGPALVCSAVYWRQASRTTLTLLLLVVLLKEFLYDGHSMISAAHLVMYMISYGTAALMYTTAMAHSKHALSTLVNAAGVMAFIALVTGEVSDFYVSGHIRFLQEPTFWLQIVATSSVGILRFFCFVKSLRLRGAFRTVFLSLVSHLFLERMYVYIQGGSAIETVALFGALNALIVL